MRAKEKDKQLERAERRDFITRRPHTSLVKGQGLLDSEILFVTLSYICNGIAVAVGRDGRID